VTGTPPTVRWEWKVLLAPGPAARVAERAGALLAPDPYAGAAPGGAYEVTSVYLAAPGDRDHDSAPRWRVRRYGGEPRLWLERKANRAGRVAKTRVAADATLAETRAADLPEGHPARGWLAEVESLGLIPAVTVAYERRAWVLAGTNARLTLDGNLRARPAARRTPEGADGVPFQEAHVLEFKFDDAPPQPFRALLAEEGLLPRPWSKVRAAARALAGVRGVRSESP
jgi:hypothetical protein